MYKYKTKDGSEVVVPGVGQSTDGVILSEVKLENPNLELVTDQDQPVAPAQPVVPVPAAPVVQPVTPALAAQNNEQNTNEIKETN